MPGEIEGQNNPDFGTNDFMGFALSGAFILMIWTIFWFLLIVIIALIVNYG